MGGCSGLSSLGDRLRDGDLPVGAVFGGVLETDAWSGGVGKQRKPRETFGCGRCTYHKASAGRSFGDGPSALARANLSLVTGLSR